MWPWRWPSPEAVARWVVVASWSADEWPSNRLRGSRRCVRTHLPVGSHPGWYRTSPVGTAPIFQPLPSGRWGYDSVTCPVIWSTAEAPAMEIISLADGVFNWIKHNLLAPFVYFWRGDLEINYQRCQRGLGQLRWMIDRITIQDDQLEQRWRKTKKKSINYIKFFFQTQL